MSLQQALHHIRRFPVPEMSRASQLKLYNFLEYLSSLSNEMQKMTVAGKLNYLTEKTTLRSIILESPTTKDGFDKLIPIADGFDTDINDFLSLVALQTDPDTFESGAEKVTLMTMHSAKGLEFPIVFITGCEADYIPYKRSNHDDPDIDEERRLFYVAMTRAKERLYLTYAKKRRIYGKQVTRKLSPFVMDIEERLRKHEDPATLKKKKPDQTQLQLF
jgi:superfamily I DNA/RNA helicase